MLVLVGLGLETRDLSVRGLGEIKDADRLFLEAYTAFIPDKYIAFLEKETGKKPTLLQRRDLEEDVKHTVAMAKRGKVVILIPGDPLIATTHSIILDEAKKQRVKWEVIHAPSIFSTAIGESGLDVYKFGPTVTIPFWSEKYKPTSFIDALERNLQNGQHTLILLDIDQKNNKPMKLSEALGIIKKAQASSLLQPISQDTRLVVMANLGRSDRLIKYVQIKDIGLNLSEGFDGKQISLILPGKMSFAEEESLRRAVSRN